MKTQAEVSIPFNSIIKRYPDGTITVKRLNCICYKVEKGYEPITDEEMRIYGNVEKKTDTERKDNTKDIRLSELQDGISNDEDEKELANKFFEVQPISDEKRAALAEEKRRRKILYNIAKTRNKIFDIARSNNFNYFITLTYSSECCDRYSFTECSRKVRVFMNNFRRLHGKTCPNFKYLLVHEQHKDGAYHYHGLIYLEDDSLLKYDPIRSKQIKMPIYNWSNWKNGFSTVSLIDNPEACRKYILKYISKNIDEDYRKGQRHFYYSQNCAKPEKESVMSDDQMLMLMKEVYRTERSTGYETTVDELNENLSIIEKFRRGEYND